MSRLGTNPIAPDRWSKAMSAETCMKTAHSGGKHAHNMRLLLPIEKSETQEKPSPILSETLEALAPEIYPNACHSATAIALNSTVQRPRATQISRTFRYPIPVPSKRRLTLCKARPRSSQGHQVQSEAVRIPPLQNGFQRPQQGWVSNVWFAGQSGHWSRLLQHPRPFCSPRTRNLQPRPDRF